jgi:acid phosphatase (class A)
MLGKIAISSSAHPGVRPMVLMRRIALIAALLLPVFGALAADAPYLTARDLDLIAILPPPAANGSPADLEQQKLVIAAQKAASPERIALAVADTGESVFDMYTGVFGPGFKAEALPLTARFFARVGESADATIDPAKKAFGRKRPWMSNTEIQPYVRKTSSGAYPSGHAARVTLAAAILSSMLPEKRALIWRRAEEYAWSRVVGGMHHPADLDASVRAGSAMAGAMFTKAAFLADYATVRAELRKHFGL